MLDRVWGSPRGLELGGSGAEWSSAGIGDWGEWVGLGRSAFPAVGFVAPVDFAVVETDDGEAFGDALAGAVPPVAADGSAGDVGDAAETDDFVDVGVALEDGEGVVSFEEREDLPGIDHRERGGG